MTQTAISDAAGALDRPATATWRRFVRRNPTLVLGAVILGLMALIALLAPLLAGDPITMQPAQRLRPPSDSNWFGTDNLGRDVYARTVFGTRVSLLVGLSVAGISVGIGLVIGLLAGYFRQDPAADATNSGRAPTPER